MKAMYPAWICGDCGEKHGSMPEGHRATWHPDKCGWCGEEKYCTEPRDYRYPPAPNYASETLASKENEIQPETVSAEPFVSDQKEI